MSLENQAVGLQVFLICLLAMLASPVRAFDWSDVPGKDIVLFYPAQMSWELLLTQDEHSGADKFREGKDCRQCHEGEERASGMVLAADPAFDSQPIDGKPGFIEATVKTVHDGEYIYVNVTFDPGDQPHAGMDDDFANKVAVMFDDGAVPEAKRAGCWGACHDNLARMPSGENADTTKYLARSRTRMSRQGSDTVKASNELDSLRASGAYLEYWQARLRPDSAPNIIDGFILEDRSQTKHPAVTAKAEKNGGTWSVTFSRLLSQGGLYKDFSAGKTYTLGISIHAGHTAQRFHYVSLEKTLVIDGGDADFVADWHATP